MRMAVRSGVATAMTLCLATAAWAQTRQPVPDPGTLIRTIAADPFRYGGDLDGSLLGLPEIGVRPVHLAMGLGIPARDGTVAGNAMLFDGERHLIAEGRIDGIVRPGSSPAGLSAPCALRLRLDGVALPDGAPSASVLPAGTVLLAGQCSATSLSGEIRSAPPRPALLGRLIAWWDDRQQSGRYWLTTDSFDPPPPLVPAL